MSHKLTKAVFGFALGFLMSGGHIQAMKNLRYLPENDKKVGEKKPSDNDKLKRDLIDDLINAINDNKLNDVKDLINKLGVNVVAKNDGSTPLHWACREGYFEITKFLLENGAKVNVKAKNNGWTPLHWACRHGYFEITKLLLKNGAEVNVKAKNDGMTPLHWACRNGYFEITKLLIEYGADATIKDNDDKTALDWLKKWPVEKLNDLCKYLLPVKQRKVETKKQKDARVFVEHNVIGAYTEQLQQGIVPLIVPKTEVAYKVTIIENHEEIIKLCDKVMSYFFVPRIKPLVSTSMPNPELSEKQYLLALKLFDCDKSAVLKILTDHPELRKQLDILAKTMENANKKDKKNYFKDLNIHFQK